MKHTLNFLKNELKSSLPRSDESLFEEFWSDQKWR